MTAMTHRDHPALHSMTGFGRAAGENGRWRLVVTLRGVNHRYLDLSLRLRDELRPSEPALRDLLADRLHRGRLEGSIEAEPLGSSLGSVEVEEGALARLVETFDALVAAGRLERGLVAGDLLRLPQVLSLTEVARSWEDEDEALLLEVAGRALDQVVEARRHEGAKLAAMLTERLQGLAAVRERLGERSPEARDQAARSLRERIESLAGDVAVDEQRLAQEVAVLAERSDVAEELDRLGAHLEHLEEILARPEGSVGKRLDFLAQEVFRELNTTGSKCRDAEMTRHVLDGKALCEQLREQVQNVE